MLLKTFCAAALVLWPSAALTADLETLASRAKVSVIHLDLLDGAGQVVGGGSGFVVSEEGDIATNYHVIDEATSVRVVLHDGRAVPALGVVGVNKDKDVAVIRASLPDIPPLPLGSTSTVQMGAEIAVIGSPTGLKGTLSAGIVSAVRTQAPEDIKIDNVPFGTSGWTIQISAPISLGSSGSPVIERKSGTVIAVAVGYRGGGQALNFAVPIEEVKAILHEAVGRELKPFKAQRKGALPWVNLLISAGLFGGLALAWRQFSARTFGARA